MGRDCQTSINSSCNFVCIFYKSSQSQVILLPRRQNCFLKGVRNHFCIRADLHTAHKEICNMSVVVKFHGGQENKRSSSRRNNNEG